VEIFAKNKTLVGFALMSKNTARVTIIYTIVCGVERRVRDRKMIYESRTAS
jgi:hypothetical protein